MSKCLFGGAKGKLCPCRHCYDLRPKAKPKAKPAPAPAPAPSKPKASKKKSDKKW
ncbi:unnamed protein product [marine sediment metagenome]|uniref:Uncharacterized protein n=1 Tax=marine sediment metagenome TaxID=412755 RepID=X0U417_9ZZZZ